MDTQAFADENQIGELEQSLQLTGRVRHCDIDGSGRGPRGAKMAAQPAAAQFGSQFRAALGVPRAELADRSAAERSSGYVIGGISPLGQRRRLPTVVDDSALAWDRVLCSAGKRGLEVALAPADLVRLTNAVTADILAV